MKNKTYNSRAQFATKFGVIATTVGSAVGLGNIWRFPYEAGTHGGGAFMLCYIAFVILLGIPVILSEFVLGRETHANYFGCFRKLRASRGWYALSYMGIIASLMIASFYAVVAGWTLKYSQWAISGQLTSVPEGTNYSEHFASFSQGIRQPVLYTAMFILINHLVVSRGVQKGIERVSNILMPLLFVILITLCINSMFLPQAAEGLRFLFRPDFTQLTPKVVIGALGQAFFSLSIGLGCMLTYASYFNAETRLVRTACITASLDTLVAILAGVIIFPAVFSYGYSPVAGPALVFEVLPAVFAQLPGGTVWASLFFVMLFVASLTSTISMSEINVTFFTEEWRMSRRAATLLSTGITLVFGVLCAMSFSGVSNIGEFSFFNFFNDFSSNVLLPLGGIGISVYVGWVLDKRILRDQLTDRATVKAPVRIIRTAIRYIAPAGIAVVFASALGMI